MWTANDIACIRRASSASGAAFPPQRSRHLIGGEDEQSRVRHAAKAIAEGASNDAAPRTPLEHPGMPTDKPLALRPGARTMLCAPDAGHARARRGADQPERRWLLRQARDVRRSFVERVIDLGAGLAAQRRWMLLQDDGVRLSYVDDVLAAAAAPDHEAIWLLRQSEALRVVCGGCAGRRERWGARLD